MKLLAVDTSTDICSVALWVDGEIREIVEPEKRHGEKLLAMVERLLAESALALAQLDAIGFSRGPGSFTSLRIGAGVVQGLAFGADLPVAAISSLAALSQGVNASAMLAALDARMQQVYWGVYRRDENGIPRLVETEIVSAPDEVPMPDGSDWAGVGSGWEVYDSLLQERFKGRVGSVFAKSRPQARHVAELAVEAVRRDETVSAELACPVYIRDNVAVKSGF